MGIAHPDTHLEVRNLIPFGDLALLNDGEGPDFFGFTLYSDGGTVGVVYALLGGEFIVFDEPKPVICLDYNTIPGAFIQEPGQETPVNVPLTWTGTLGTPPVTTVIVVSGSSYPATLIHGRIEFTPVMTLDFVRGDCNDDSLVDISDGVFVLNFLFQGGPAGVCAFACDANRDGMNDSSDAIFILNYRFLEGPPPSEPFPDCGQREGQTPEDCESYSHCP